jgi:hypothetical protein
MSETRHPERRLAARSGRRDPYCRLRRILQGSAPFVAGALLACGSPTPEPPETDALAWVSRPPGGCAAGVSGPTLDPGHAIRQARTRALENLAAETLGVEIESELRFGDGGVSEVTRQQIDGVIAHSRIVAIRSPRRSGDADSDALRPVYALACRENAGAAGIGRPDYPHWILNAPRRTGQICVMGVGGPTRRSDQQEEAALRDGRRALAKALEIHVRQVSLDDGRGLAHVASESQATERARAAAEQVPALDEDWLDEDGRGPLVVPGVVYGLLCADL